MKLFTLARRFHSKHGVQRGGERGDLIQKIKMVLLDTFLYCKAANICRMDLTD